MATLLNIWYLKSPGWIYRFYLLTLGQLEVSIGVQDMAHNLRRPLFQDYTFQGRIIGLLLRLLRILAGCLLYLLIAVAYLIGYLVWLAFPFICLVSLAGAFFGTTGGGI
jgi:hypothetical protein